MPFSSTESTSTDIQLDNSNTANIINLAHPDTSYGRVAAEENARRGTEAAREAEAWAHELKIEDIKLADLQRQRAGQGSSGEQQ